MSTATTLSTERRVADPQLRLAAAEGVQALQRVLGITTVEARARLRFGPGRTCEPLARLLDRAIAQAVDGGLNPDNLVVAGGDIEPAEDIVRVRRKAHGKADWIHSPTSRVELLLQPAGLYEVARTPPTAHDQVPVDIPRAQPGHVDDPADDPAAAAVREALFDVIDPDLGVNVVDLGFVRGLHVEAGTAVITMTLTSAACPLTGVMEDQIRTELGTVDAVGDHRVDWVWSPAWRPSDITDSGREQLRAIGFTV
jgi:metal-sulfur cluster biosynthetic enzyme/ribosomal protein L22